MAGESCKTCNSLLSLEREIGFLKKENKQLNMKIRILAIGLTLSGAAIVGLAQHEGFRSKAYNDGVGVQTIGFGTTKGVKPGDTITVERALVRLNEDVAFFEKEMKKCIGDVPLYQHEWDAYVSLTYNIGYAGFCKSTIVKKLKQNPPDYAGACEAIKLWNKAGGKVLQGLVKRREDEYKKCKGL